MIKVKINKTRYKVFTQWNELPEANLTALVVPELLIKFYKAKAEERPKHLKMLASEDLTGFYVEALQMFSNIPIEVLRQTDIQDLMLIYDNTIEPLIADIANYNFVSHIPERVKVKSEFINEIEIPSYEISARAFCEATDLFNAGRNDLRMLRFIPHIYRAKQYDEKAILKAYSKRTKAKCGKMLDFFFIMRQRWGLWLTVTRKYLRVEAVLRCRKSELRGLSKNQVNQVLEQLNIWEACRFMNSSTSFNISGLNRQK